MGGIYEIDRVKPVIGPGSYIHPDATIIGDVIIGANCYIGPGASLRGDFGTIKIGNGSNVQDNCVLHSFPGRECLVTEFGHISHGAVLHGCIIEKYGFVGINAVVMDGAVVEENAMVAAMAFIKADFIVPKESLAAGMPAKVVRQLSELELEWKVGGLAAYQQLAQRSMQSLYSTEPLPAPEENRPTLQQDGSVALNELKREA